MIAYDIHFMLFGLSLMKSVEFHMLPHERTWLREKLHFKFQLEKHF